MSAAFSQVVPLSQLLSRPADPVHFLRRSTCNDSFRSRGAKLGAVSKGTQFDVNQDGGTQFDNSDLETFLDDLEAKHRGFPSKTSSHYSNFSASPLSSNFRPFKGDSNKDDLLRSSWAGRGVPFQEKEPVDEKSLMMDIDWEHNPWARHPTPPPPQPSVAESRPSSSAPPPPPPSPSRTSVGDYLRGSPSASAAPSPSDPSPLFSEELGQLANELSRAAEKAQSLGDQSILVSEALKLGENLRSYLASDPLSISSDVVSLAQDVCNLLNSFIPPERTPTKTSPSSMPSVDPLSVPARLGARPVPTSFESALRESAPATSDSTPPVQSLPPALAVEQSITPTPSSAPKPMSVNLLESDVKKDIPTLETLLSGTSKAAEASADIQKVVNALEKLLVSASGQTSMPLPAESDSSADRLQSLLSNRTTLIEVPIESWTDVSDFLESCDALEYLPNFKEHDLSVEKLKSRHFDRNILHDIVGVARAGPLVRILDGLDQLRDFDGAR
mmetsp:Transcript_39970/g.64840  ORF Transcript_39970/g.64840 Transcript_39970/m.64840 type:complete len:501 (-) Transcript_39970:598-2100(-)|eukprot:CAMPEP_0184651314 /NCGR_PEP_ID=MMETSP0308-20130426/8902_1 /TAXON_ID=38269 /ORGANISM="Gloeochaete witrockiana, Strain SAG 46.84" /LENGTH=500 /DNA_ID=CAMNT_0027085441 /DNA_START=2975 /DNA_END=4477 /DNA_ORIENTATION=-